MTNSSVGQLVAEISLIIVYINKLITWELKTNSESVLVFLNGPNSEVFLIINKLVKINNESKQNAAMATGLGRWEFLLFLQNLII